MNDIIEIMNKIAAKYPLRHNYQEDARYTWPDRWYMLHLVLKDADLYQTYLLEQKDCEK